MQVSTAKFLHEDWRVKVRNDGALTDWLPARRLQGEFSIYFNGSWVTGNESQNQDCVIEESGFVSSSISQTPSVGYGPFLGQYSAISIQWLSWVQEDRKTESKIYIRHALNDGEVNLPGTRYMLDGLCPETNTAYEFNGCYWHGCPIFFPHQRQQLKHVRTNQSMDELLALTLKKDDTLNQLGQSMSARGNTILRTY